MEPLQNEIDAITRRLSELIIKQVREELSETLAHQAADIVLARMKQPDLISKKEAIELLDIDPSTLYHWEKKGKLHRHGMIGNKVYYSRRAIERILTNKN